MEPQPHKTQVKFLEALAEKMNSENEDNAEVLFSSEDALACKNHRAVVKLPQKLKQKCENM